MKRLELDFIYKDDKAVDCSHCPVSSELKCCTYQPLWLCFSVGEALATTDVEERLINVLPDFILSPVGFSASLKKRKLFAQKGKWGFSKEADLLCSFYDKGHCSVWSTRPSVCRFYFCKSDKGMKGLELYQEVEQWLLTVEGSLLYLWLMEKGYNMKDWNTLTTYLEEEELLKGQMKELPEHLVFNEWTQAKAFYLESYEWIKNKSKEEILGLSGKEKLAEYQTLVAQSKQL